MRKQVYLSWLVLLVGISQATAQVLTDDVEGKSSIVQYSNSVNFDLAKTALSVGFNNYRAYKIAGKQTLWGVSASARNATGVGALLSGGKFQPQSNLQGFLGKRKKLITRRQEAAFCQLENERQHLANDPARHQLVQLKNYGPAIDSLIDSQVRVSQSEKKRLQASIDSILQKSIDDAPFLAALDALHRRLLLTAKPMAQVVSAVSKLISDRQQIVQLLEARAGLITNQLINNAQQFKELDLVRKYRLLYLSGGFNAASFSVYNPAVGSTADDRFVKTPCRGGFIDIGINYDYTAHWLFGGSIGYERANTFENLSSTDYVVRTTETLGNQQLISETKYTGYTGDFRLYDRANIRTDILYFKALNPQDSTAYQIAWNILYTRSFISFNPIAAKSRINIGSGLNFYNVKKGSFLGGIYLELTDLTNSQQATTDVFGRLAFGVVAKYAFQSIMNRFNNP